MKKSAISVLAAGVLLTGCGPSEAAPSPRRAYEAAYEQGKLMRGIFQEPGSPETSVLDVIKLCHKDGAGVAGSVAEAEHDGCVAGRLGEESKAYKYKEKP
ncbi:hypothetical protein [Streptomyces sp. NPDC096339]|uniref:hypothetical protein n=1 Tax=Streptomyces sp. NPDC096339 TaxID=3366086 RepID=UPI00381DB535